MLEFMGKPDYLDVDKIIQKCRPAPGETGQNDDAEGEKFNELNVFKFECYKACLDRVLSEYQIEEDDAMAAFTTKTTNVSFGIAFNTLLKNEILREDD